MLTRTCEYALRAVVYLEVHRDRQPCVREIATATHTPVGYLAKILQVLARRGIVHSRRGQRGGFALSHPGNAIRVLDVLRATDSPVQRVAKCPLGIPGHTELCPLHRLIDAAIRSLEKAFEKVSIANIVSGLDPSDPMWGVVTTEPRGRAARRSAPQKRPPARGAAPPAKSRTSRRK